MPSPTHRIAVVADSGSHVTGYVPRGRATGTARRPAEAGPDTPREVTGTLRRDHPHIPVGSGGRGTGLRTALAAVALGAVLAERHATLDPATRGGDRAAPVEPQGPTRPVRDNRTTGTTFGDGVKRAHGSELAPMRTLRRVPAPV
ncbi:N-acetylneuraminate synthase family protein [Streptomyces kanasensis]|uniref:N-acetylneuraminate synthase family protein n=1 Tax=Streptomyces kanasensis TaxID=936756 RepID=UPI003700BD9B